MPKTNRSKSSLFVIARRRKKGVRRFVTRHDLDGISDRLGWMMYSSLGRHDAKIALKIVDFGRPFLGAFNPLQVHSKKRSFKVSLVGEAYESPVGLAVQVIDAKTSFPRAIGRAKLLFEKRAVLIEAVQGVKGGIKELKDFEGIVQCPWPTFLIKKITSTARRLGYRELRFRDPETLRWYKNPASANPAVTQKRMKFFYSKIREGTGPWERKGDYWVKEL